MKDAVTDFLFARPSVLTGLARILDFGNTLHEYNTSPSSELADYFAMQSDWAVTGNDMWAAISHFRADNPELPATGEWLTE